MRERRRLVLVGVVAGIVLQLVAGQVPVGATTLPSTISGVAEWDGMATLPTWPCPGNCGGSFTGSLRGTFTGIDVAGQTYTLTFPDPGAPTQAGNLTLPSWTYDEPCPIVTQSPPVTGSASGSFAASGGLLTDAGVSSHNASLTGQFFWNRYGVIVVVNVNSIAVVNASGQTVASPLRPVGDAVGVFVPTTVLVPPAGTCLALGSMTATVAGTMAYPA